MNNQYDKCPECGAKALYKRKKDNSEICYNCGYDTSEPKTKEEGEIYIKINFKKVIKKTAKLNKTRWVSAKDAKKAILANMDLPNRGDIMHIFREIVSEDDNYLIDNEENPYKIRYKTI